MALQTYSPPSTKIVHTTAVDFTSRPSIFKPVHLAQYDDKLPVVAVSLYNNGQEYVLPPGADANIRLGSYKGYGCRLRKTSGCCRGHKR